MTNVDLLTDAHLTNARSAPNGRSAEVVLHDGPLRQTILALRAGVELGEHNSPPAASIQVPGPARVSAWGSASGSPAGRPTGTRSARSAAVAPAAGSRSMSAAQPE